MKISLIDNNKQLQDDVICNIRDLVNVKNLERGDKLPSERIMSEKFGVNRNHIREAIKKLEYYGIVKSFAKSGTLLEIGRIGFNGMVNEIITIDQPSFEELVQTRITLELKIVGLAAEKRTHEDLTNIQNCLNDFKCKITNGEEYLEEDLLFHLAIAKASKNSTMLTLMLQITPPILATYEKEIVCEGDSIAAEIEKHENIFKAIETQDIALAEKMMKKHFHKLSNFTKHQI
ncbi:MAG: FadR/GntR family transcriptional regulator [Wenyingzhuangia sp.]|uniref:FadR/GntR family transcriptional regulator n=1 Tax=Wenyingzhuangia sp. TaxID=1964193 RepID=UPI00321BCD11